jgi:hypothetical protein
MAARGRPPSPALLSALQLVKDGYPVEAASKAAGIGKHCVWVILAKHKALLPLVSDRAAAALLSYADDGPLTLDELKRLRKIAAASLPKGRQISKRSLF